MLLTWVVFVALAVGTWVNLVFRVGMTPVEVEIESLEDWSDPTGASDVKAIIRLPDGQRGVVGLPSRAVGPHEVGDHITVSWRRGWVMRDSPNVVYGSGISVLRGPALFALAPIVWLLWRLAIQ